MDQMLAHIEHTKIQSIDCLMTIKLNRPPSAIVP